MLVVLLRSASYACALALCVLAGSASAQVTLHLTTPAQTSCNASTDSNGLSLVPGSTDLQATGVTFSGTGCGGGTANFQASVSAPGTATVGTPINVDWSAGPDATLCIYGTPSLGVTGWPSGTQACTGAACAGTHTVPVTITSAGNYTFGMTCTNSSGVGVSQTVVASNGGGGGGGGDCPAGRVLTSSISYPGDGGATRQQGDLTTFEGIWGHLTPTDPPVLWPGVRGDTVTINTIPKTGYIAAAFHVPVGTNPFLGGYYSSDGYNAGPDIDISVSAACGDFAPAQEGCHQEVRHANDMHALDWRMQNPTDFQCMLTPDADYYVNIKFSDPNTTGPGCTGSNCRLTMLHQWSIQTP
jgi:hypothetical protein